MVTLPQLKDYSDSEFARVKDYSSVAQRYLYLIEQPTKTFHQEIRKIRHRYWLRCCFATVTSRASAEDICLFWSECAYEILKKAWDEVGLLDSNIFLIAMGKLGSAELNLSSDIDIILSYDDLETELQNFRGPLRKFLSLMSEVTDWGFCFRVDLDLRPGGSSGSLVTSLAAIENYYSQYGEAWNRMGFLRSQALFGTDTIRERFHQFRDRYCFPRRLDFAIIETMKSLRGKIQFQQPQIEGINLKFNPGGIRDIEIYIQSLQMLYGGRLLELKTSKMSLAIRSLISTQKLSQTQGEFFLKFYWELRELENWVQVEGDRHSYSLDKQYQKSVCPPFSHSTLISKLEISQKYIMNFFNKPSEINSDSVSLELSKDAKNHIHKVKNDILEKRKNKKSLNSNRELIGTTLEAFYSYSLQINVAPFKALERFRDLLVELKSDSLLLVFEKKIEIIRHLAWLFSYSSYAGQLLVARPELLDSFIMGQVFLNPEESDTQSFLQDLLDYKWLNQMVSMSHFLKSCDLESLIESFSSCADTVARNILFHLKRQFSNSSLEILCLGKWGGREMGLFSDLDFIFIATRPVNSDDRSLARRFTNLVSSPARGGSLFKVDLRLKPATLAGPLIVEEEHLREFILNQAKPWQKQAYLKSRFLEIKSGRSSLFSKYVETGTPILTSDQSAEINNNLQQLIHDPKDGFLDIKYQSGGLVHTEFIVQKLVLRTSGILIKSNLKEQISIIKGIDERLDPIYKNYLFFRTRQQLFSIFTNLSKSKIKVNHEALEAMAKVLGGQSEIFSELVSRMENQRDLLKGLDANS